MQSTDDFGDGGGNQTFWSNWSSVDPSAVDARDVNRTVCPAGVYSDGTCRVEWPLWVEVSVPLICVAVYVLALVVIFMKPGNKPDSARIYSPKTAGGAEGEEYVRLKGGVNSGVGPGGASTSASSWEKFRNAKKKGGIRKTDSKRPLRASEYESAGSPV